jgi:hypothetical protein
VPISRFVHMRLDCLDAIIGKSVHFDLNLHLLRQNTDGLVVFKCSRRWRCRLESLCRLKLRRSRRRRNHCVDRKLHVGKVTLNPIVVQGEHVGTYDLLLCLIHSYGLAICHGTVARRNIKLGAKSPRKGLPEVSHKPGIEYQFPW